MTVVDIMIVLLFVIVGGSLLFCFIYGYVSSVQLKNDMKEAIEWAKEDTQKRREAEQAMEQNRQQHVQRNVTVSFRPFD